MERMPPRVFGRSPQAAAASALGEEEVPATGAAGVDTCVRRQCAPRLDWAGLLHRTFAVDV